MGNDIAIFGVPMIILFIIYYKVFRIADDIKEMKKLLKSNVESKRNELNNI